MAKMLNHKRLKENKFVVPEGYFDSFEKELFQTLSVEMPSEKPNNRFIFYQRYVVSAAAAILIIFATVWFFYNRIQTNYYQNTEYLLSGYDLNQFYYEYETSESTEFTEWTSENHLIYELDEPLFISMLNN